MADVNNNGQGLGPAGKEQVLVVIDVQNGVVEHAWDRDGMLERLATLIDRARSTDVPVVYVQHVADDLADGTEPWRVHPRVAPHDGEPIIAKRYGDAFVETTLPETLAQFNAGHLIIAGAQTSACIRATTHRAMGLGYDVTLAGDCHTTDDIAWDGLSITGEQQVKYFNLAIRFSEYPGQNIEVLPQSEIVLRSSAAIR